MFSLILLAVDIWLLFKSSWNPSGIELIKDRKLSGMMKKIRESATHVESVVFGVVNLARVWHQVNEQRCLERNSQEWDLLGLGQITTMSNANITNWYSIPSTPIPHYQMCNRDWCPDFALWGVRAHGIEKRRPARMARAAATILIPLPCLWLLYSIGTLIRGPLPGREGILVRQNWS